MNRSFDETSLQVANIFPIACGIVLGLDHPNLGHEYSGDLHLFLEIFLFEAIYMKA